MTRREVAELPTLPAQIAAAARSAADARRTLALALAPSISDDDFTVYCGVILAKHDAEQATIAELVESTAALAQRTAQRARNCTAMLRDCFERAGAIERKPSEAHSVAGASSWVPSCSLVAGLMRGVK